MTFCYACFHLRVFRTWHQFPVYARMFHACCHSFPRLPSTLILVSSHGCLGAPAILPTSKVGNIHKKLGNFHSAQSLGHRLKNSCLRLSQKSKSCVAGGFVCRARKWAVKLRGEWDGSLFGGTLRVFEWGFAAGTLEPLAYTRASSSEFYYPILH